MPVGNVIRGPNGEIISTPSEIPTGLISYYGLYVKSIREYYESLLGMVQECEAAREREDRRQGDREVQWLPWAFDIFAEFASPAGRRERTITGSE